MKEKTNFARTRCGRLSTVDMFKTQAYIARTPKLKKFLVHRGGHANVYNSVILVNFNHSDYRNPDLLGH